MLLALAMAGWGWAGVRWARARPLADRVRWVAVGAALLGAVVVTAALVAAAYGRAGVPAASGLAAALPVAVVLITGAGRRPTDAPARAAGTGSR